MDFKKIEIKDLEEIALNLVELAEHNLSNKATVIALYGDLGSGKTTLTQILGKKLGIKNKIFHEAFR